MIPSSTNSPRSPAPGDSRAQRRQAFVDAGRAAFFAHGYGATTMSSIAAAVGGSKTTLWSYFPSKQDLFAAVIDDIVDRFAQAVSFEFDPVAPVEPVLRHFGEALMETLLSEQILALHRIVMGEALRFPELGAMFNERGAKRGKARLAAFLGAAMGDGRLRAGDPMVATRQFAAMCQSGRFQEVLLGIDTAPAPDAVAGDVAAAVDTFMRAWGVAT